jgi:hypothetical protein
MLMFFNDLFIGIIKHLNKPVYGSIFRKELLHKDMTITDKGFFMARSKFNPEAVHVMADEFIANMYDNYNDSMQKWKDLLVLSVDGSKITVPDTTLANRSLYVVFRR